MPAHLPGLSPAAANKLVELGKRIRERRKALSINATVAAEAAGMSRVTLYRIEKGAHAVTMGAYLNIMTALNIEFGILTATDVQAEDRTGWIPARIRLTDYPQLKQLAWQIHGIDEVTPVEALSIYERNWRHMDTLLLEPREKQLIDALRLGLSNRDGIV